MRVKKTQFWFVQKDRTYVVRWVGKGRGPHLGMVYLDEVGPCVVDASEVEMVTFSTYERITNAAQAHRRLCAVLEEYPELKTFLPAPMRKAGVE